MKLYHTIRFACTIAYFIFSFHNLFGMFDLLAWGCCRSNRNINAKNEYGETRLHRAVRSQNLDKVKKLLAAGADVHIQDRAGWAPLHRAARRNYVTIVEALIEGGADVNDRSGSDAIMMAPLHYAALGSHLRITELLLGAGANPNIQDLLGCTPLHRAVRNNSESIVRSLIVAGADPYREDDNNWSAFDYVVSNPDMIQVFVESLEQQRVVMIEKERKERMANCHRVNIVAKGKKLPEEIERHILACLQSPKNKSN